MSRVPHIDRSEAPAESKALLNAIHGAFGTTPNMFRAVASSPAALKSMWGAFGALGGGVIPAKLGEQIAVAVADRNACEYCLAALRFALKLVNDRGKVSDSDVRALRDAGFGDDAIVEIVAHVALNLFTNYANVAFAVPVDFPAVKLRHVA